MPLLSVVHSSLSQLPALFGTFLTQVILQGKALYVKVLNGFSDTILVQLHLAVSLLL